MKLNNGDTFQIMKQMVAEGVKVDSIITDPPYELQRPGNTTSESLGTGGWMGQAGKSTDVIGFNTDISFGSWLPLAYEILKDDRYIFVMVNDFNLIEALNSFEKAGFHFTKLIVWKKPNKVVSPFLMQNKEYVIFGRKGQTPRIKENGAIGLIDTRDENGEKITDVIQTKHISKNEKLHNSQKPLDLLEPIINMSTLKDWVVFDPFMGSGSTGVACKNLGREFIGVELDEEYFNIAKRRIENEIK